MGGEDESSIGKRVQLFDRAFLRDRRDPLEELFVLFFFQAEDGIRDYKVTGVQTCALPIWPAGGLGLAHSWALGPRTAPACGRTGAATGPAPAVAVTVARPLERRAGRPGRGQIGRASCRERV